MEPNSTLFALAGRECQKAWESGRLSALSKPEQISRLASVLGRGGARDIAALLMEMAWAPYSGAGGYVGLDGNKAARLNVALLTALVEPFVRARTSAGEVDLGEVKAAIVSWIDTGALPEPHGRAAEDLVKITDLIGGCEARISLTAPFAAPIEFAILALGHRAAVGSGDVREH